MPGLLIEPKMSGNMPDLLTMASDPPMETLAMVIAGKAKTKLGLRLTTCPE